MPKIKKTEANPFGLSIKQEGVIEDTVERIKNQEGVDLVNSHLKFYNAKNKNSASTLAAQNLRSVDFRRALISSLRENNIIGKGGKVERRLGEGLDATKEDSGGDERTDFNVRLKYIKEINKIAGAYAPQKTESKTLNINTEMTEEQLQDKINQLRDELGAS